MVLALKKVGKKREASPNCRVKSINGKKMHSFDLSAFVTKQSMNFFNRFSIFSQFLAENPQKWLLNHWFGAGINLLKNLRAVNDNAERAVPY